MRVIAGIAKGRNLAVVPGEGTRPIYDRVKTALFDTLSSQVEGARFLDLYAGTGAVGIEALSRGAERATFVELAPKAVRVLHQNLQATGLAEKAEVVQRDVFKYVAANSGDQFDIIYLAPPQYQGLVPKTLAALDESGLLADHTLVIAQQHPKESQEFPLRRLELVDKRQYGTTVLFFFEPRDGE